MMKKIQRYLFPLVLLLYPLRHINWGLDLWDTGYNYSNFQFMGMEHMDPMWLFSTYLANAAGALLTKLPFGDTLMGMNFYTGLTVSLLALSGYYFCTKKVGMPAPLVFLGEILAVSLCWCPTALLYNYLTYLLFLGGSIFLYLGLRDDKNKLLAVAGLCLGINIFVRFSNLPEAALILAVWGYGIICRQKIRKVAAQTGWCVLGYLCAVATGLGYLGIRYGFGIYVESILRLFGMTETATDYTAVSMVMKMVQAYLDMIYWIVRVMIFAVPGLILFAVRPGKWMGFKRTCSVLLAVSALAWLYAGGFCSVRFYEYNAMLRPGIVFLMLAMFIGVIVIFHPKLPKEDKLISGIVILIILLTSLGSNNGVFPSLNNLFIVAPYVFWLVWRFCKSFDLLLPVRSAASGRWAGIHGFPIKAMAVMLIGLMLAQGIGFGAGFVFVEAAGAREVDTQVENNSVLKGIYMSEERARWLSEISAYVEEEGLVGNSVLLYGDIPALSYYLNMPPAFNSWSDLDSYSLQAMTEDMAELESEIEAGGLLPVVILEQKYRDYDSMTGEDPKLGLLSAFMDKYGYVRTFDSEKFLILEPLEG